MEHCVYLTQHALISKHGVCRIAVQCRGVSRIFIMGFPTVRNYRLYKAEDTGGSSGGSVATSCKLADGSKSSWSATEEGQLKQL